MNWQRLVHQIRSIALVSPKVSRKLCKSSGSIEVGASVNFFANRKDACSAFEKLDQSPLASRAVRFAIPDGFSPRILRIPAAASPLDWLPSNLSKREVSFCVRAATAYRRLLMRCFKYRLTMRKTAEFTWSATQRSYWAMGAAHNPSAPL